MFSALKQLQKRRKDMYAQAQQQNIKGNILNNILLAMSVYVNKTALDVMQRVVEEQLVKVNMEEISTLPAIQETSMDEQNEYYLKLLVIKKKNLQKKTLEQYVSAARRLAEHIHKPLNEVDDMDIDYYLRWYQMKNVSTTGKENKATTVNNERRFLSAFFTWMRKARFRQDNPVESTEMNKIEKKPIDYFTDEEIEKLREGCETVRERAILEVLRSTGARVGEITTINRGDINWTTGDVIILGEKGSGYRTGYIDETARHYLKKYIKERTDQAEGLFVARRAPYNNLTPAGIRLEINTIGKRTDLTCRIYPHKFRKTLGMALKRKGEDLGVIQEILGHQDPTTTSRYYAESTVETLRDIRKRCA